MDCQSCQHSQVDLLYGELAPDVADAARDHIADCTECQSAFTTLERGQQLAAQLPLPEPPEAVSQQLMELAEVHAQQRVRAHAAAAAADERGPWSRFVDFVRRFAMAPQVGMATIMLLIVAVGLWSVPELEHSPDVAGDTVVNPDPDGEATASQGVQPAEPLDLKVDMRRRRIRSGAEEDGQLAKLAESEPAAAETAPPAAPSEAAAAPRADDPLAGILDDRFGELGRVGKGASGLGSATGASGGPKEAKPEALREGVGLEAEEAIAQAFPGSLGTRSSAGGGSARVTAKKSKARPARKAAAPAQVSPEGYDRGASANSAPLADAIAAAPAERREQQAAEKPASTAPREKLSAQARATALERARALRAAKGCRAALPTYQRVVDGAGRTRVTGEALLEMAECRRSLGQEALARSLLESAAKVPAVATRARRMIAQRAPAASPKGKRAKPAEAKSGAADALEGQAAPAAPTEF